MKQFFLAGLSTFFALPVAAHATSTLAFELNNPLQFGNFEDLIVGVLNVLLIIAVPIIIFFIIFAGFSYVTAQGNPEKISQASRSLTYAIIGGVLILGAVAISEIIKSVVCEFSSNPARCMSGGTSFVDTPAVFASEDKITQLQINS